MILTEPAAAELWCPLLPRYLKPGGMDVANDCRCIASRCTAWRWAQKPNPDWVIPSGVQMSSSQRDTRYDPPLFIEDKTRGYCGLAGRPG